MVTSWFSQGDAEVPIKTLIQHLNPKRSTTLPTQRFSQLLLEHGERTIQDWAVVAYSSVVQDSVSSAPSKERKQEVVWEQAPPSRGGAAHEKRSNNPTRTTAMHYSQGLKQQEKLGHGKTNNIHSYPSANMTKTEGRLHLCSRSIVFEPNEPTRPIVRCPFTKMEDSPTEYPRDKSFGAMCVEFYAKRHYAMKENNVIGPFRHIHLTTHFQFTFLHSTPTEFIQLCQKLYDMATKTKGPSPELEALLTPLLNRPFDLHNLVDVREQPLTTSIRASILTPLQSTPGTVLLTAERVYFQPAGGLLLQPTKAQHWLQRNVVATARRYKGLRDAALEIYWKDGTSTLCAMERRHDREVLLRSLSKAPCVTDRNFVVRLVEEWNKGHIDNFEYLMGLNSAAGRTFHDLSRYPVFPWVLADYDSPKLDFTALSTYRDLSKPIGALDDERLDYFRNRMESMHDMGEPFLYGTHYSAPGYVLYYLVRSMPEHMLCLQNGKFDAPDRMFHSVSQCFKCVLKNHADVKELIPEFYDTSFSFDWLINVRGLQLGATQLGERVDDVSLPPWARSARDFVKKCRKALESGSCTEILPQWIDLVFGVKSRGEEARIADNLFHPITYLGPSELADMQSEEERFQAELQATEFGIVPDLIFENKHPRRGASQTSVDELVSNSLGRAPGANEAELSGRDAWELLESPVIEHDVQRVIPSLISESNGDNSTATIKKVSKEALGKMHTSRSLIVEVEDNNVVSMPDRPFTTAPPLTALTEAASVESVSQTVSGWDLKSVDKKRVHSDGVSACVLLCDEKGQMVLATTSLDGGLMVHTISYDAAVEEDTSQKAFPSLSRFTYSTILNRTHLSASQQSKLVEFRHHATRDPLASLALALDGAGGYVAFAGGHDDVVLAYGVNSGCALASVYSHRDAVTSIFLIPRTPFDAESALWLENSTHLMVSGSWDATCKIWSVTLKAGEAVAVSRNPIVELFDTSSSIGCISAMTIPGNGIAIAAGCADGSFSIWNVHSDGVQVLLHNEPAKRGSGPCSAVKWISAHGMTHLLAAFSTGKVAVFTLSGTNVHRKSAVSVGVSVLSLDHLDGIVLTGCADGGLRLLPLGRDGTFSGPPTLWPEAVNKESSGITSISITTNPRDQGFLCCCGGDDGSIAVFELKNAVK